MKRIIAAFLILAAASSMSSARDIKGTVSCAGRTLSGVVVTDGVHFTRTNAKGAYVLNTAYEANYVYVVTPAGYIGDFSSGTPVFYSALKNSRDTYDIELERFSSKRKNFTIFSISDPQIKNRDQMKDFTSKPLHDLIRQGKKYASKGALVGIALGDIGWDSIEYTYTPYKHALKQLNFPIYPVIGNHDHNLKKIGVKSRDDYEEEFGPSNYAFWIGKDLVICVDNIIYDTNKKYKEGYSQDVLDFVKGVLEYAPRGTHIFFAQHSPAYTWHTDSYIVNAEKMFSILKGYDVDMLSGHTHMMNNYEYKGHIRDHNAPSICGAWWATDWCRDGEPAGYEIFKSRNGKLEWFYHSIGHKDDYQVEIIKPGESKKYPDSVIANIWDYDEGWSVRWYQDGEDMGPMEQVTDCSPVYRKQIASWYKKNGEATFRQPFENRHYFKADPQKDAKVLVVVKNRFGKEWKFEL